MRLAIIPPIRYLDDFSTDTHLVLAHLYKANKAYRAFYKEVRARGELVMMDNGAAELGASIPPEELYTIAMELKPQVLVCPDVLHNAGTTLQATGCFLSAYASRLKEAGVELMAVPQGEDAKAWMAVYEQFNADPKVSWLGISKYAPVQRLVLLQHIRDTVAKMCHLLGLADDVDVIEEEKRFSFVESTDTAVPVKLGLQGLSLEGYSKRGKMSDETYFNYSRGLDKKLFNQVLFNISEYKKRCERWPAQNR